LRSLLWDRPTRIEEVRERIWRYVSPAAQEEQVLLEAAALLQMTDVEVLRLGRVHFLLSDEVRAVLEDMPRLARSLATTTALEEEWSSERIRGSIQWSKTFGARSATGIPNLYVTAPARRAYQTPENELLVFVLDAIDELARKTGWHRLETERVGRTVAIRFGQVQRWRQLRALLEVERRPPNPRSLARIRSGRHRRRYGSVLGAYACHRRLVGHLDRSAVREVVESRAIVARADPVLFELLCLFQVLDALVLLGWRMSRWGFVQPAAPFIAQRGPDRVHVWYQHAPRELRDSHSRYYRIQRTHSLGPSEVRPDIVLRISKGGLITWLVVEAKLGLTRGVEDSARAALFDLLGYRRAFEKTLTKQEAPYGLGVAWGEELTPERDEILLCSPDCIGQALSLAGLA
jgi:hypothetical protein